MNNWITVRTAAALFLVLFGIGLAFARSADGRIFIGSALAAVGLTFLLRLTLALRGN